MRLTKKKWHQLCGRKKDWFEYVPNKYSSHDRIYKLGQLEDFEDNLGIELLVLLKAKQDGAYYRFKTRVGNMPHPKNINFGRVGCVSFDNKTLKIGGYSHKLSEYGETWALTREELE